MDKILEFEQKGLFNQHINPISYENTYPVDENFEYVKLSFLTKVKRFFQRMFIVNPYSIYQNKKIMHTRIIGRENIKGIKKAIVTCNHVYMFDCLAIKKAMKGRQCQFVVADFNNKKGFLGDMMRASGILPLSTNFTARKNLNRAIDHHLNNNHFVCLYPEEAMWDYYEKPRPYRIGAYHYAVKYDVPIIPIFITFRTPTNKKDKKYFTLNIMKPIYKKDNLSTKENENYLKEANFELCKNKYEDFYQTPLVYNTLKND